MLEPQSVFAWIIIGAIAGWLAGLLVKGYGFGLIGNIVIGILGAGIAGLLAPGARPLHPIVRWQHRRGIARRAHSLAACRPRAPHLAAIVQEAEPQ